MSTAGARDEVPDPAARESVLTDRSTFARLTLGSLARRPDIAALRYGTHRPFGETWHVWPARMQEEAIVEMRYETRLARSVAVNPRRAC